LQLPSGFKEGRGKRGKLNSIIVKKQGEGKTILQLESSLGVERTEMKHNGPEEGKRKMI